MPQEEKMCIEAASSGLLEEIPTLAELQLH
jgi:hypothetical protein